MFWGCNKKLIKISPDYQSKYFKTGLLFIQFVPALPEIEISDLLLNSLGSGSKNKIFHTYFKKEFPQFVKKHASFHQVEETWTDAFNVLAKLLFSNSPFRKHK
jgi:hypothetical protein